MAGYFTKLNGHVYEGEYTAAEELANGVFAEITADGVKKITVAGDAEFVIDEKTTLWGANAVRMHCVNEGSKDQYLVENEFEDYGDKDIDYAEYTVQKGHFVKMRAPEKGDQIIVSVEDTLYNSLSVGDTVTPAANGTIAKKA